MAVQVDDQDSMRAPWSRPVHCSSRPSYGRADGVRGSRAGSSSWAKGSMVRRMRELAAYSVLGLFLQACCSCPQPAEAPENMEAPPPVEAAPPPEPNAAPEPKPAPEPVAEPAPKQ